MFKEQTLNEARALVLKNKTTEAIDLLLQDVPEGDEKDGLLLLKTQIIGIQIQKDEGVIRYTDYSIENNRINVRFG